MGNLKISGDSRRTLKILFARLTPLQAAGNALALHFQKESPVFLSKFKLLRIY